MLHFVFPARREARFTAIMAGVAICNDHEHSCKKAIVYVPDIT